MELVITTANVCKNIGSLVISMILSNFLMLICYYKKRMKKIYRIDMNELPDDLLVKIMLYSNNSLYSINKYMNNLVKKLKSNYLLNPIIVYYRLVKWTYQTGSPLIINLNRRPEYRPRMKVGKIKKAKIHKIELGEVKKDIIYIHQRN